MIPSEFVNVERFPLSTNGKIDRKGLAESIQKNIKVKHNAKATLISQKKEYVELAKSIKKSYALFLEMIILIMKIIY